MKAELSVHPEARNELRDAILYYRKVSPYVAAEFVDVYEAAVAEILLAPKSHPLIIDECRRKVLRKFPFSIFYSVAGNEVRLLAIVNQYREPFYWLGRS